MSICAPQPANPSEERNEPVSYRPIPSILPGTVCVQYVRCGKPTCACRAGKLHGPYHYRVWRVGGAVQKVYVRPEEVQAVSAACEAYGQLSRTLRFLRRERQALTDRLERDVRRSRRLLERVSFGRASRNRGK